MNHELSCLIDHMSTNRLLPSERIVVDGNWHEYQVSINGISREAIYTATAYPLGNDGPPLLCVYGLVDETQQYQYSSPINRK
jgi:hypothetical protein